MGTESSVDLKLSRRFVEQVLKRCAPFGLRVHSDSKKMDQYQKRTETDGRNTGAKKFVVPSTRHGVSSDTVGSKQKRAGVRLGGVRGAPAQAFKPEGAGRNPSLSEPGVCSTHR